MDESEKQIMLSGRSHMQKALKKEMATLWKSKTMVTDTNGGQGLE